MRSDHLKTDYREPESTRTGRSIKAIKQDFIDNLFYHQAKFPAVSTRNDYYLALAYTVRDRLLYRWINTAETYREKQSRTVCYLSAEFLLGPHLGNNLINLGIYNQTAKAMTELGLNLQELIEQEEEPGLGNGGLGRLAACYMDSLATLSIPAIGYGIRYEFGIFDQEIQNGWQKEVTDKWLRLGNPWEIPHPEIAYEVKAGGRTEAYKDAQGHHRVRWIPERIIRGIPYDTPILGYAVNTANLLRLWKSEACESFDFKAFNEGDYYGSVEDKVVSENITKVLYPNDEPAAGKELRLLQQYFFVSCSLQDMLRIYEQTNGDLSAFHQKYAVQLNDTHPAVAVAELMRLLVDERNLAWEPAWEIVRQTFAYTNHTLLPEALEKWPIALFQHLLPRHLEIIYEINRRFLEETARRFPGDQDLLARLSLIDESGERYVRMANLACVGSHAVNGVARLHSELLKKDVLGDFYKLRPEKFQNITNGVTPRRFMVLANPSLTSLISSRIGRKWINDLQELKGIEDHLADLDFCREWRNAKFANKQILADLIQKRTGVTVDPHSLFDIQVKRIHEYKRQHLNVLHVLSLYLRLKRECGTGGPARTCIFGGKAAPGYHMAKLIIKLIHAAAELINNDGDIQGRLKVVFFPDFNVKNSHPIYPAADLSEQISTAGKEASGTGNMKFSLNGALTIGTLDGANVEIREEVGPDNFFLFGLTAPEVQARREKGYRPRDLYESNAELRAVLELIGSGILAGGDRDLFQPLLDSLLNHDPYFLLADYPSYMEAQERVNRAYSDQELWTRMSMVNVARMGKFSSDRAIRQYCEEIWQVKSVPIRLKMIKSEYLNPKLETNSKPQ